jgi:hypothetical protein
MKYSSFPSRRQEIPPSAPSRVIWTGFTISDGSWSSATYNSKRPDSFELYAIKRPSGEKRPPRAENLSRTSATGPESPFTDNAYIVSPAQKQSSPDDAMKTAVPGACL